MSTHGRFLLLIAASLLVMLVVTSPPVAGQGQEGAPNCAAGIVGCGSGDGRAARVTKSAFPPGPIPRRPDGKPDLTGNWDGSGGTLTHTVILEDHPGGFGIQGGKTLIIDPKDGIIPYQPWALAERDRRRQDANGYEDQVGHCEFYDIARVQMFARQIMFSGNSVIMNETQHITRIIPMDRTTHLPEGIRLWWGDPIGRWDGDTLVVDSVNFTERPRMALGGDFHGPDAHTVERFTMADANTINWTLTMENPKVFTRPWTMTSSTPMFRVAAPRGGEDFDGEDTCHEGNIDLVHLKNIYDQAHAKDATKPKPF